MKILITGGAGYVGYSLVKQLLETLSPLHSIAIYDNLSRRNLSFFTEADFGHKPLEFIHADILDGRSLTKALKGKDCIIHLAARVTTPFADQEAHYFDQVNHWGSSLVADAIEDAGVPMVIYTSSTAVYGPSSTPLSEEAIPQPQSFYGISKLDGERAFQRLAPKHKVYILRSANVYGYNPSYRIDALVNRLLFGAHFLGKIQVHGDGAQQRSFIHVHSLAKMLTAAVDQRMAPGLYNAVEHDHSVSDVAEILKDMYPAMESIQVNFNMPMRSTLARRNDLLWQAIGQQPGSLRAALEDFRGHFSF